MASPVVSMYDTNFGPIGVDVEPGSSVRLEVDGGSHSPTDGQWAANTESVSAPITHARVVSLARKIPQDAE